MHHRYTSIACTNLCFYCIFTSGLTPSSSLCSDIGLSGLPAFDLNALPRGDSLTISAGVPGRLPVKRRQCTQIWGGSKIFGRCSSQHIAIKGRKWATTTWINITGFLLFRKDKNFMIVQWSIAFLFFLCGLDILLYFCCTGGGNWDLL